MPDIAQQSESGTALATYPLMTVRFQTYQRIPRTSRLEVTGSVLVPCEIVESGLEVGHGTGCRVRLLAKGGGYPVGHIITVGNNQLES